MSKINYTEDELKYRIVIGKRIAELRHYYGFTQEELADRMRIAPRSLSDIETGKSSPNSIMIYRISCAFGISLFEFYDFKIFQDN